MIAPKARNGQSVDARHSQNLKNFVAAQYRLAWTTRQVPNVDVNSKIEDQLKSHDILLYMKGTPDFPQCGFSGQTVAALNAIGKPYAFVNIFEDQEVREGLKAYSNWPTFPQLYVKGELVGGCDIVIEMYQSGELKDLLES